MCKIPQNGATLNIFSLAKKKRGIKDSTISSNSVRPSDGGNQNSEPGNAPVLRSYMYTTRMNVVITLSVSLASIRPSPKSLRAVTNCHVSPLTSACPNSGNR
jgi:hypothetical protein